MDYDLIVIGSGPAGVEASIKASRLGKKVLCVEKNKLGGTCLNFGCIPTKALIKPAELFFEIKKSEEFGISVEKLTFDYKKIVARAKEVVAKLGKSVEFTLKKSKVAVEFAHCKILDSNTVFLTYDSGETKKVSAEKILITTGSNAVKIKAFDSPKTYTSKESLFFDEIPKTPVILGAGAIGLEFAYLWNSLGANVTVVEMQDNILPTGDAQISKALARSLGKQGISIKTSTKALSLRYENEKVFLDIDEKGKLSTLESDCLLLAVGVRPELSGLFDENLKIEQENSFIKVDSTYKTSIDNIYAAGDIIGAPMLAHIASHEASQAVQAMFENKTSFDKKPYPACVYCHPQVASVGAKENELPNTKSSIVQFFANGKALASGDNEGFVKIISDTNTNIILGAHIIGANASELIAECTLAIENKLTLSDLTNTIHAHPSLSEVFVSL